MLMRSLPLRGGGGTTGAGAGTTGIICCGRTSRRAMAGGTMNVSRFSATCGDGDGAGVGRVAFSVPYARRVRIIKWIVAEIRKP